MFRFLLVAAAVFAFSDAGIIQQGRPRLDGRIVGGKPADIKDFPHQVSVQFKGEHICGGSIIADSYVLCAAHCIVANKPGKFDIRAGSTNKSSGGVLMSVVKIFVHDLWDPKTMDFDFAIFQIKGKFTYGPTIAKIPLTAIEPKDGVNVKVSGWGDLSSGGSSPENLYAVELQVLKRDKCAADYASENSDISAVMICATANNKDSCQGDSGGPLITFKPTAVQVGVVSWGIGCADPKYPGVYSNIANDTARAWIKTIAGV